MKKIVKLGICLLMLVACLTSCSGLLDSLNTTSNYRLFRDFSQNYEVGMDKQEIFEELGYPVVSIDTDGNRHIQNYSYENREAFKEIIMNINSIEWQYTCYELPDSVNPYCLTVYFDSEGKCTNVEFTPIQGE